MFELKAVPQSWIPQVHIGLRIALQQFIFDRQLRLAAEQPIHLAQLNSKLFSLGEYMLSPV